MPLSETLKARLASRGLIRKSQGEREYVEEVIAEDYSGGDPHNQEIAMRWFPKCPNRQNSFHSCTDYCEKRYGLQMFTGGNNIDIERKRHRMLRIYPLPDGWKEIADPESNRYFYVNPSTGQVCWLSPAHPKARLYSSTGQRIRDSSGNRSKSRGHDHEKSTRRPADDRYNSRSRDYKRDRSRSPRR